MAWGWVGQMLDINAKWSAIGTSPAFRWIVTILQRHLPFRGASSFPPNMCGVFPLSLSSSNYQRFYGCSICAYTFKDSYHFVVSILNTQTSLMARNPHNYNNLPGLCETHKKSDFVNIIDVLEPSSGYLNSTSKLLQIS